MFTYAAVLSQAVPAAMPQVCQIFVEILIVVSAFKSTFNGSTHFSMRTASLLSLRSERSERAAL